MDKHQNSKHNVQLSKKLSWLLRHGAAKEGLELSSEGFIAVEKILQHRNFRNYSLDEIKQVVACNDKQRFSLRTNGINILEIRANQGHSIKTVQDLELKQIHSHLEVPIVVHGTYLKNWASIKNQGLSRMRRNHIHFAKGLPKDKKVISGMRANCEVLIYIDLEKALKDGLKFFISPNEVILCPGDENGYLKSQYFSKVVKVGNGEILN